MRNRVRRRPRLRWAEAELGGEGPLSGRELMSDPGAIRKQGWASYGPRERPRPAGGRKARTQHDGCREHHRLGPNRSKRLPHAIVAAALARIPDRHSRRDPGHRPARVL
jgi:hypothetical protein